MCDLLNEYKLAKWPLLTVCPFYYSPDAEVFIKPTTVKGVIEYFELEGLKYSSKPTFEFYQAYREQINRMKQQVTSLMPVDNGAFCGFLMMSTETTPVSSNRALKTPNEQDNIDKTPADGYLRVLSID